MVGVVESNHGWCKEAWRGRLMPFDVDETPIYLISYVIIISISITRK
jgi:hypothetical protein